MFRKKNINTTEYLELKKGLESLRIEFEGMKLEFDLIIKKLKIKYRISNKDKEEETDKDISKVLLPE